MKAGQLLCAIIFCLLSPRVTAQGKLLFHHLTLEDGLSEQTNSFIYKDSRGFVWISSVNGLNRFDGVHIRQYTPNAAVPGSINGENIQSSFFEDRDGRMWFCSYVAINAYDPKQDTFAHFKINTGDEPKTGYYIFYLDSLSNLWLIVEEKSIYKFNTKTKEATKVASLKFEAARALMIESSPGVPGTFFTYATTLPTLEVFKIKDGHLIESSTLRDPVSGAIFSPRKIINDGDSLIWFSQKDMLVKFHIENQRVQFYPKKNIHTLEILNSSTLLISVEKEGLWEFDKATGAFVSQYVHEPDNPSSLISNTIQYLSIDKDGGIWASSTGKGISFGYPDKNKFMLTRLSSLTDQSSIDLNGMQVDHGGNLFCSTRSNGLYTLNRDVRIINEWKFTDEQSWQRAHSVFSIFTDKAYNKFICSFKGLSVIPPGVDKMQHITDGNTVMWSPYQLDDGRIIFSASHGGLYETVQRNGSYTLTRIDSSGFDTEYMAVHQDKKGFIWINRQLIKIFIVDPLTFKIVDSIPIEGIIEDIIETDTSDIIWLAGSNGLFKISRDNYQILAVYNKDRTLDCAGISNMIMDDHGKLWLTCSNQVIKFDPQTEAIKTYDEHDGLPYSQFIRSVSCRLPDGEMWFASNGTMVTFHPDRLHHLAIKAIPQITSFLINDEPPLSTIVCRATGASNISEIKELCLSHRNNTISFVVNSLEYSAPENNKVQFMLENVDSDWVTAASGTQVRYPNLPAGTFLFKVRAANSDGEFNHAMIRELSITVTPPFYKTWWFIALTASALLGLILYIMYLNFSKKLEVQKERLRLYENLHDEVGSRLTSIVFMAEEAARDQQDHPRLGQISKVAKNIVANMRRLVWATDPENDSMQSLVQKIRLDKSMILDDKIDFHLELDPQLKDMTVLGEIRYQVTSVISEALNNISKYAGAKNVYILLNKENNLLNLRIRDDGVGFNPEATKVDKLKSSGYGLGNMQKRIARVKGTLSIDSKPGQGTTIDVRIPLT